MNAMHDSLVNFDRCGRLRYAPEQNAALSEAYAAIGLSGPEFAALHGVNDQIFGNPSTEHLLHFCERSLSSRSYAMAIASALGGWAWVLIHWAGRRAGRSSFVGSCMSFSKTHSRVPKRRDAGTPAGPLRGSAKFQGPSSKKSKRPCLERAGRGSSAGIIGGEESTG